MDGRRLETDVEAVTGPLQLPGEVAIGLRAGARHEPDPQGDEGKRQSPVRLEETLGREGAQQPSSGGRDAADERLDVEGGHGEAELAAALPDRDLASQAHDKPRRQLDSDRGELILDDRPVARPARHLERGDGVAARRAAATGLHAVNGLLSTTVFVVRELEIVVPPRSRHLADLTGDPDLFGKGLLERPTHTVVEVADRQRRVRGRPGQDARPGQADQGGWHSLGRGRGDHGRGRNRVGDGAGCGREHRSPGAVASGLVVRGNRGDGLVADCVPVPDEVEAKLLDAGHLRVPRPLDSGAGHEVRLPLGGDGAPGSPCRIPLPDPRARSRCEIPVRDPRASLSSTTRTGSPPESAGSAPSGLPRPQAARPRTR